MRRDLTIVALGVGFALVPLVLGNYWVGLLTQALIYAAVAASLDLLIGYCGLPSLGHAAFFGMAGYGIGILTTNYGVDPMLSAVIGVGVTTIIAAALAPFFTRLRGLGFITVTLAFGQVVWGLAVRGGSLTGGENGIASIPRPLLPADMLATRDGFYWTTVILVIAVLIVVTRLAHSAFGLSLQGIREASQRMDAIGYEVNARKSIVFIITAGFAAVLGAWFVFFNQFVGPSTLNWTTSATFLLAVVVGGSGTLWGPFLAGGSLLVIETTLTGQTQIWPLVLGLLYVVTVLVIPEGIASVPDKLRGARRRARMVGSWP